MISGDLLNEDILSLGMRADDARRANGGARVLYQRVHVLDARELAGDVAVAEPATEVRLIGLPDTREEALALVRRTKAAAGARPVCAFSAADLLERANAGWGPFDALLTELAAAGLADFAEMPVDRLDDTVSVIRSSRGAGLLAARLTLSDAPGDRKGEILDRIRRCVSSSMAPARVNPLPRHVAADRPTTGYEDVRMVALTRLALANAATRPIHVEVDWSIYGPKLAQVALTFGADFLDAVPATTDETLGRRRGTVEDVERNIRAAGFEPEEYRPA